MPQGAGDSLSGCESRDRKEALKAQELPSETIPIQTASEDGCWQVAGPAQWAPGITYVLSQIQPFPGITPKK